MAKLRCTHNCSTGAKVSYSHHTLFTQASFHGTKVAHVAPRSPRCSGTFQLVSFFFKCANVPSANCFCPKQKMYFFKLENVKKKRWPRCVGRFPVGLFTPNVQLPSTPASEFKHWRPGTPLLLCSLCSLYSLCSSEFKHWAIGPSFLPCSPGFLGFSVLSPGCMEGATEWSVRSTDISGLIVVIDQDGARWYGVRTAWVKGEAKDTFPGFPRRLWEATVWPEWKNQRGLGTSQVDSWNPLHSWHGHLLFYYR